MQTDHPNRRDVTTRSHPWARTLSTTLARSGVTPNQVSLLSILFSALGTFTLLDLPGWRGMLLCALTIQGRLICNLLDGMIALEGGKKTASGVLYNEIPDRLSDSLYLVALGAMTMQPWLGWACALTAALTAYIRLLGGSLGFPQDFCGPMAKQHRMAVLTVACLTGSLENTLYGSHWSFLIASIVILTGSILTCIKRTTHIARRLETEAAG